MADYLFQLPDNNTNTLQVQIQEMLVSAILDGYLPADAALPSSRRLAKQLKVARNTVVNAYQHLVDEGYLLSRERSGFFVNGEILRGRLAAQNERATKRSTIDWQSKLQVKPFSFTVKSKLANWEQYPYPFICGQYDRKTFPIADWRECCRDALAVSAIHAWAKDQVDYDHQELIAQIQNKVLPRRGVWADREQILVTVGAQQAIYLTAQLLLDKDKVMGFENPGYVDARNTFELFTQQLQPLEIDDEGLIPDERFARCELVYTTPSHQYPTTVTMSKARRLELLEQANKHDVLILEDDYEAEFNYVGEPSPALKSLDQEGRVIYVGSLSKTLAPGIRLGYMVAPRAIIEQARALRRLMLRHPPSNNQFIIAQFLKRGYHDSLILKLSQALQHRWDLIGNLLGEHQGSHYRRPSFGGSAYWLQLPEEFNSTDKLPEAMAAGVIYEPGGEFFYGKQQPDNYLRLGFSSLTSEQISGGLPLLLNMLK